MQKKDVGTLMTGMVLGAALTGSATAINVIAEPASSSISVDGQQVPMTAYSTDSINYVWLRDIGQAVGFNVYWKNSVQVDTSSPYTGVPPTQISAGVQQTDQGELKIYGWKS